ncbi:hypothetical protein, partial [Tritonibacter mobilis]|uniref:hypothetical protein n=1 Tax=Tritonibacter mobilis TaxID=379347 RepID=UPI001CD9847D
MTWLIRSFAGAMYERHAALRALLKPEVIAAREKIAAGYDLARCLVPECGGLPICDHHKDALWDNFFTAAPRPRTPSELS